MALALSQQQVQQRTLIAKAFGWMFIGLALTAGVALYASRSEGLQRLVLGNGGVFLVLILVELGLVMGISWGIQRISAATAAGLFLLYSALNGLTLSVIFLVYELGAIYQAFFVAAGMFGGMSLYGYTTKRDLTALGSLAMMGLFGVILASVVNWFLASSALYWAITYIGVAVFLGLTAYDTQKLRKMSEAGLNEEDTRRYAVLGALALYLDFVNLFLFLLRIFGRRR